LKLKPLKSGALSEKAKIYIRKYIKTMDLEKDNKLPNEDLLADLLGVSRITIRSALNDLASEGIILRRQGKGTFVNHEAMQIKVQLNPVVEFKQMITNSGYTPSVKLLSIETKKSDKTINCMLKLPEDSDIDIAVVKKVFYANGHPCILCIDYFPNDLVPAGKEFEKIYNYETSIFEFLNDIAGRTVTWDKIEIMTTCSFNNNELEDVFNCSCDNIKPFLMIKGVNFDSDDNPLIYAEEYIDTDFIRFSMIRQKIINYE
jgi:GntR family transcriptional regulator